MVRSAAARAWLTTETIDGASMCLILADPERVLYTCTWEYELASGEGPVGYEHEVERVRFCLGEVAEREDTSVNHPDFWASTYFEIPDGEVIVSLKNKSSLGISLVTIGASVGSRLDGA